jgi:hypothetical protein
MAAMHMAQNHPEMTTEPIASVRARLRNMGAADWRAAYGGPDGEVYRKVWRVLEGID